MNAHYISVAGYGQLMKITGRAGRMLTVSIEGAEDGYLTIGQASCRYSGGEGSVCLTALPDGIYHPVLNCKGYTLRLEPLCIEGNKVSACPTEDGIIRILLDRAAALENRLAALEERCDLLSEQVSGRGLFDGMFN